jgi:hypothetical protein
MQGAQSASSQLLYLKAHILRIIAAMEPAPPVVAVPTETVDATSMHAIAQNSNAILARLKDVETSNATLLTVVEKLKVEVQAKDDKIKDLSADKRKDMEQMIETAVDKWLNSLTEVPDDVRQQFKKGISKIAEQADMKNAAWEIVCNASTAHESNVKKIDELLRTCNEQGETIKILMSSGADPTFAAEASRMAGAKRGRLDNEAATPVPPPCASTRDSSGPDAWQEFERMMRVDMSAKYF